MSDAFEDTNAMLFQIWVKKQSSWDRRPGFLSCVGCHGYCFMNRSKQLNKLWSVLPKTLCTSYFLVTRDNSRWQQGRQSPWPSPASLAVIWKKRELCFFFFSQFCKVEWRPLLPLLCFQPRISEIENLRHQVINIQRIYFFIKHMHMLLCGVGFLSFPRTVLCFCW